MHFMYRGITAPTLVQPKAKAKAAKKGNWLSRAMGQAKAAGDALLDKQLPITMPAQAVATPRETIGFKLNAVATPSAPQAASPQSAAKSVATAKTATDMVQVKYLERARKSFVSDLRAWEAKGRSGATSAPKNIERLTAEINALDAQLGKLK